MSANLQQLSRQVSYLTYEIQNGPGSQAIETINSILPDASHNFAITAGSNISITNQTNGITIAASGGDSFSYIVGSMSQYATIQAAINAASGLASFTNPCTIFVQSGTYTETITLSPNINLTAIGITFLNGSINWNNAHNNTFNCSIKGFTITNTDNHPCLNFVYPSGSGYINLYLYDCITNGYNNDCIYMSGTINVYGFNLINNANSGYRLLNFSNNSGFYFYSIVNNGTNTESIVSGSAPNFFVGYVGTESFILQNALIYTTNMIITSYNNLPAFALDNNSVLLIGNTTISTNALYWVDGYNSTYGSVGYYNVNANNSGTVIPISPNLTILNTTSQFNSLSFDNGLTQFNPTVLPNNQIVLGAGHSGLQSLSNPSNPSILSYNGTSLVWTSSIISTLNQQISSAVVSSWNNGASLTIPANSRFQVSVTISTNYNPVYTSQPPPWSAFSISLYTASRYYGLTLGNPTSTNNYIYASATLPNTSGSKPSVNSCCVIQDVFDLSSDSATSANISFYFINWDNTNIGSLNYSIVVTPI